MENDYPSLDFSNLPPHKKLPILNVSSDGILSNTLFQVSSRFGDKVLNDVWKNIRDLKAYLEEIPSQERFEKIMKTKLTFDEIFMFEAVKLNLPPENKAFVENYIEERKKGTWKETYAYRLDLIKSYLTKTEIVEKEIKNIFVLEDTPNKPLDHFVCNPIVKDFLFGLHQKRKFHKLMKIIECFDQLMISYNNISIIEIMTSSPISKNDENELKEYAINNSPIMIENDKLMITFTVDKNLKGGFKIMYDHHITKDYSFTNAVKEAKQYYKQKQIRAQ